MSACTEFSQNAWRKDLCANCLRPRSDHNIGNSLAIGKIKPKLVDTRSPPIPAKRNSTLIKTNSLGCSRLSNDNGIETGVSKVGESLPATIKNYKEQLTKEALSKKLLRLAEDHSSNGKDFNQKSSFHNSETKTAIFQESLSCKPLKSALTKEKAKNRKCRNIVFTESGPDIIGYDGGIDFLDSEDEVPSPTEPVPTRRISLTEEEKQFALLSLENTLWNSDIHNLRIETPLEGRLKRVPSKEFEDVELESLWKPDRFLGLVDIDLQKKKFGTFPRWNRTTKIKSVIRTSAEISFDRSSKSESEAEDNKYKQKSVVCEKSDSVAAKVSNEEKQPVLVQLQNNQDGIQAGHKKQSERSAAVEENTLNMAKDKPRVKPELQPKVVKPYRVANVPKSMNVDVSSKTSDKHFDNISSKTVPFDTELEVQQKIESINNNSDCISDLDKKRTFSKSGASEVTVMEKLFVSKTELMHSSISESMTVSKNDVNMRSDSVSEKCGKLDTKSPIATKRATQQSQNQQKESSLHIRHEEVSEHESKTESSILEKKHKDDIVSIKMESEMHEVRFSKVKSVDFETKMASLAASLDFNKGKRQAPQPPHSSSSEVLNSPAKPATTNPDPSFKFALASKTSQQALEQSSSLSKQSIQEEPGPSETMEGFKVKTDSKVKRGFASIFRNFLRRGKDSSSDSSTEGSSGDNTQGITQKSFDYSKEQLSGSLDTKIDAVGNSEEGKIIVEETSGAQFRVRVFPSPTKSTVSVASTASSTSGDAAAESKSTNEPVISEGKQDSGERNRESIEEQDESNPPSRKSTMSKEPVRSNSLSNGSATSETSDDVVVVRRRIKSPKKAPAPNVPKNASMDNKNTLIAKELEQRLSKAVDGKSTLKKSPAPQPPVIPPPLPDDSEDKENPVEQGRLSSQDEAADSATVMVDTRPVEKIELPKAAQSRRSFLGKFAGNRRSRPPPPPVKRAKSITEASLPVHDLHLKKIDLSDISGPVMIAEMSSSGSPSRRNTVTLGDDSAFGSGGSTSSGSGGDKPYDDHAASPGESAENLYEPITPKCPKSGQRDNFYYPVDPSLSNSASRTSSTVSSSLPTEGYLEPIRTSGVDPVKPSVIEPTQSSVTESSAESSPQLSAELPPDKQETHLGDEREKILASQPIYEEINGYSKENSNNVRPPPLPKDNKVPRSVILADQLLTKPRSKSSENLNQEAQPQPHQGQQQSLGTLTRPKPAPRKKPKRPHGAPPEQYVAMNRPSNANNLGSDDVKDMFSKLTAMNQDTLQHIHNYFENLFAKNVEKPLSHLKWQDFEITNREPVHTSESCIVYSAKTVQERASCHLVLTYDDTLTDSSVPHPAFMKLQNLSVKDIPSSFVTKAMDQQQQQRGSHHSQVVTNHSWHVLVGQYSSLFGWHTYISDLKDTMLHNPDSFVQILSFLFLQVISGIIHHLDRGSPHLEFEPVDIFLLSQKNFSGKRVCLLPCFKSTSSPVTSMNEFCAKLLEDLFEKYIIPDEKLVECAKGLRRVLDLLQADQPDCLAVVRGMLELLIWGPYPNELTARGCISREQSFEFWLDKERSMMVNRFARCSLDPSGTLSIEDFYKLRFLLNSTGASLVEVSQQLS